MEVDARPKHKRTEVFKYFLIGFRWTERGQHHLITKGTLNTFNHQLSTLTTYEDLTPKQIPRKRLALTLIYHKQSTDTLELSAFP